MKKIFCFLLCMLIFCTPAFSMSGDVPVLLYHNVTQRDIPGGELMHITPAMLEEHFKTLADNGYTAISTSEYYEHCTTGKKIPDKSIIINFDDGYISNYEYAYPLLKKYGMKATIYIVTNTVGAQNLEFPHFSWAQAIEMENSGYVQIESHSASHADFSKLTYEQTVFEMRLSKFAIETNMKKQCRFFAYPYGQTNSVSSSVAFASPYVMTSIVSNEGYANYHNDFYQIPRHTVSGKMTGEQLLTYIQSIKN